MARQHRRGPKLPFARMERAVELRFLGFKWGEIEKAIKIPHSTLMRWYATEEWKAMEAEHLAHDPLLRRARTVISNALGYELFKKGRPDTALAERILALHGNGAGAGGFSQHPGVIIVPMQNRGLESRPATQVLLPPPTVTQPEAAIARAKKSTSRRRVAGPDE